VRLSRCEVRDHINYRKNDRWRSYRFYRAAAAEIAQALHLRDFRSPAIFEFFNTIRHKRPIRDGRMGEIEGQDGFEAMVFVSLEPRGGRDGEGTVMPTPPAVPENTWKFGGPDFAEGALNSENFINDRITDLRQFEAGNPPRMCP
jgi:hypothetical protein